MNHRFAALGAIALATALSFLAFAQVSLPTKSHETKPCANKHLRFDTTPGVEGAGVNKVLVINDAVHAFKDERCGVATEISIGGGRSSLVKVIAITPTGERLEATGNRIALQGKAVTTITTQHQFHNDTWEHTWTNVGIGGATLAEGSGTPTPLAALSPTPTPTPTGPCIESGPNRSPACTLQCTKKFWRWNFWVTQFNVDGSAGLGEHQGIGVIGNEYLFDPRFPPSAGERRAWDLTDEVNAFAAKVSRPDNAEVEGAALCGMGRTMFRLIYNHGRTLATQEPGDVGYSDPPMERLDTITQGPIAYNLWRNAQNGTVQRSGAITTCVQQIQDGFCDSVCGNCSYVIPSGAGIGDVDRTFLLTGQTTQFTVNEPTIPTWYFHGGAGTWGGDTYADPFTHCFSQATGAPQQALLSRLVWGTGQGRAITGLFGHNSNTDAEAEFLHFQSCRINPGATLTRQIPTACNACGTATSAGGKPIQYPCVARTNTAREKWARTDGLHNIDDEDAGTQPSHGSPPTCLTNGQPVRGM